MCLAVFYWMVRAAGSFSNIALFSLFVVCSRAVTTYLNNLPQTDIYRALLHGRSLFRAACQALYCKQVYLLGTMSIENSLAAEQAIQPLWRDLCLRQWSSVDTDPEAWKLIDKHLEPAAPTRWCSISPKVNKTPQWKFRLQKANTFVGNLVGHHTTLAS